jgi:hypothetical protein
MLYVRYDHLTKEAYSLETNPSSRQRKCYIRIMTARVQLGEPGGGQDELIGGEPPVVKKLWFWGGVTSSSQTPSFVEKWASISKHVKLERTKIWSLKQRMIVLARASLSHGRYTNLRRLKCSIGSSWCASCCVSLSSAVVTVDDNLSCHCSIEAGNQLRGKGRQYLGFCNTWASSFKQEGRINLFFNTWRRSLKWTDVKTLWCLHVG